MKALIEKIECTFWLRMTVALIFGSVVGGAAVVFLERISHDYRVPVKFQSVQTLNSPISEGDILAVRAYRTKVRSDCIVKSARYATNSDGVLHDIPDTIAPGGAAGTEYFDIYYDTTSLPVGQYTLHVALTYYCDRGATFNILQPTVNFRVVE